MTKDAPADRVSRARYDRERRARAEAETLLEAKSRELYEANKRLISEAEVVRTALAETEALRIREATALREQSILSDALTALSGKADTGEAVRALLHALRQGFDILDACLATDRDGVVMLAAAARPDHAGLALPLPAGLLERPRRLGRLADLAGGQPLPGRLGALASVLVAPLAIPGGPRGALLLGCESEGRFAPADLRLLERVAGVAAQALLALRETRRNALLVSLLEGRPVEGQGGGLDAPLEAVHRAFARLTDMQGDVVGILDALLAAPLAGTDAAIDAALARMGRATATDRVYVFRLRPAGDFIDNSHEWCAPGIAPAREMLQGIPAEMILHWRAEFEAGREVLIPDVAAMPDTAPEKPILQEQGIRSLLTVPMLEDGAFRGFVGYDSVLSQRSFLPGEVHLIRSVAKVIASVLARRDAEARLIAANAETAAQRTRLLSVLSAMPDLIVELDRAGRFVTWHSGAIVVPDSLGAAFAGQTLEAVLPPELAAEARQILAEIDAGRRPEPRSFPFALMGAWERWWQLSASVMGEDGYLFVMRDITEVRLQTAEIERLSEIARRTTNLVVVTDAERRIEWVNGAFERTTGWTLDEVRGRSPGSILQCPATDPATVADIRAALQAGAPVQAEILNRSREGRDYWVALDIQPLRRIDGKLAGFMAVQTEVTERRAQADALRLAAEDAANARAALEAAVNALPDGFVLFDRDARLVAVNRRYREMFPESADLMQPGVTFEALLRRSLACGQMVEVAGREEAWLSERLRQFRDARGTVETKLSGGRWIQESDHPTPDGGRVGLRFDITALKLAEQRALADRSAAMEASQDGIAITDAQGRFLYMNKAHLAMFRLTTEAEITGQPWSVLYGPEALGWLQLNAMPKLFAEGRWSGEIVGRARDGSPVDQDVSLTLQPGGGILCITRDISARRREAAERERLNDELHLAQRREVVGRMAAGLAHDFNNLLATIAGSASLIETAVVPGGMAAQGVERIAAAAAKAAELVKRLMALGSRPSDRRPIDLRQPLRDAADLVRASLKSGLRLDLHLPETAVEAVADPTDVLQVVLNLAINARDALGATPGRITLALAPATEVEGPFAVGAVDPGRPHLCLTVADTGPGMTPDLAARAFQPYVTTKGDQGTGLGLDIVASVVTSYGGAVRLRTAPGAGARFDVFWPLGRVAADAAGAGPRAAAGAALTGRLDGRAILVVDDQQDVLDVLCAMLEAAGAEVAPSTEPADIEAAVRADPAAWDLVITDYDMPGLTGSDLLDRLRAVAPALPVILVTALAGVAGRSEARFDAVIAKPVDRAALVSAAEAAILARQSTGQVPCES